MTFQELMMKSLTDLLEEEEILKYPIYATLMQRGKHWFGYFGLTDEYLLIALLEGSSQIISWTSRVPLDIKKVKVIIMVLRKIIQHGLLSNVLKKGNGITYD